MHDIISHADTYSILFAFFLLYGSTAMGCGRRQKLDKCISSELT